MDEYIYWTNLLKRRFIKKIENRNIYYYYFFCDLVDGCFVVLAFVAGVDVDVVDNVALNVSAIYWDEVVLIVIILP